MGRDRHHTASESDGKRLGRGKRVKRTRAVYSPTPNQESSTDEIESDSEDTRTSSVPPIPNCSAETFNPSSTIRKTNWRSSTFGFCQTGSEKVSSLLKLEPSLTGTTFFDQSKGRILNVNFTLDLS
ncbi:Uncharacterized protein APZ42_014798 [Daphnia magna]|uniref:Uncharacterized protein n=1 Tax=Daphnia magna TaxID=35525 RepID=A0A162PKH0_9CRUS|nr:Uncharacterized protein APZ42_014798 [Daphnia magna]